MGDRSSDASALLGMDGFVVLARTGLTEMMGTRHPRKWRLTRENGREGPNVSCYYASL